MKRLIFLILILCSVSYGANDFSGDDNCCAVWNVEEDALTTDSKGTNTLTNVNMSSDLVTFKQGAGSVLGDSLVDRLYIADANLDAGFPLKNGDANKKISISKWFMVSGFPASGTRVLMVKGEGGQNSIYFRLHKDTTWRFYLGIGHTGGTDWEYLDHGSTIATGIWYHVTVTFQDSDKAYKIRIWDDNAGAILGGATVTGNSTNNINIEEGIFFATGYTGSALGGQRDEIVVFNDILTDDEIDQIRGGTYAAGAAPAGGQVIMIGEF